MRKILLTQGKVALVDDGDFKYLNQFKWCLSHRGNNGYAVRQKNRKKVLMQYVILPKREGLQLDHINGNRVDNRKVNLRYCTKKQNSRNMLPRRKYKGVYLKKDRLHTKKKYETQIRFNYKGIHVGYFESEKDAALAYDNAARKYFGEFARLNFPT